MYITMNFFFFFFNDTATTEIYTLSLHDALPISVVRPADAAKDELLLFPEVGTNVAARSGSPEHDDKLFDGCDVVDRKSTRLNSSHLVISYAVFCLKKKKL